MADLAEANIADDAMILHPEEQLTLAGRPVTVGELSFRQELALGPLIPDLIADLDTMVGDGSDLSGLFDALYRYPDVLLTMLEMSTGEDRDWIESLSGPEGDELVMTFYGVNAGFFARRLHVRRILATAGKR